MPQIPAILRPIASKVIAYVVLAGLTFLAAKTNVPLFTDPEFVTQVQVALGAWLFGTVAHTTISVKTNPANAASPSLAVEGKIVAEEKKNG